MGSPKAKIEAMRVALGELRMSAESLTGRGNYQRRSDPSETGAPRDDVASLADAADAQADCARLIRRPFRFPLAQSAAL
jgi:hypothetical protein